MTMTDPIADMLTRVRNATLAKHEKVDIPSSRLKIAIAKILTEEGYIESYKTLEDKKQNVIRIHLKYDADKKGAIENIERVSKPGRRVYVGKDEIPYTLRGYGISILSTSKGVLTDRDARKEQIGGEVLLRVW
jgi:small subunit ribosomal protein S8